MNTDTRSVADLEEAVRNGEDGITAAQLAEARDRELLSGLRSEADLRKAERKAEAERLEAIAALRAEIEATPTGRAAELAQRVADAVQEFKAHVEQHNHDLWQWRHRAAQLDAGWPLDSCLQVSGREFNPINAESWLTIAGRGKHADVSPLATNHD